MRNKWYLALVWILLLCSIKTAMAQNHNSLTIANDHLILQIDLQSPKNVLDSILKTAGIKAGSAAQLVKGDFNAVVNDGWTMTSKMDNILRFERPLTDLDNNPQSNPGRITVNIPNIDGKPGYPGEVNYGVNKFAKITVYELSTGLTRFILPGYERSKRVFLSGSFNNWSTLKGLMKKTDGGWILDIKLNAGAYEYKYIADGRWTTDPNNLVQADDGGGTLNSVYFKYNYTFKLSAHATARRIVVAGDFNNWNAGELIMEHKGNVWERPMYLADGKYYYRFMVDGQWINDPGNPVKIKQNENDTYLSSVLNLGETVVFKLSGYPNAKKVALAGDFKSFSENELTLHKKGSAWVLPLTLMAGNYSYRFIVDGNSLVDPANPHVSVIENQPWSFLAVRPNYTFTLGGYSKAQVVTLCSKINDWEPSGYTMAHQGDEWTMPFYLKPGKYLYKFRVDGEWIRDPGNKLWEQNQEHTGNSVLWIE